jgi:hypothetical protein
MKHRKKILIGVLVIVLVGGVALAAFSANYITHPVELDQGGEGAASLSYQQYGSLGGMALGGTSGSPNHINTSSFVPGLFPGATAQPIDLLLTPGPSNPPDTNETAGAAGVPVLQLALTAGPQMDVEVQAVSFTAAGSGDDQNDVTGIRLVQDDNGDGAAAGSEAILASQAAGFPVNDGVVTFAGLAHTIPAATTEYWLLVYDFSGSAPASATFSVRVAIDADVSAVDVATSSPIAPRGAPVRGGIKTIAGALTPGSLRVFTESGLADPLPLPGQGGVTVFPFGLGASSVEDISLSRLRFTGSGTGDDAAGVAAVRLVRDADGDGVLGTGDVEIGSSVYPSDDASLEFTGLTETVPAGSSLRMLVVYDLSSSVLGGHSFGVALSKSTDVGATGVTTTQNVAPSGTPAGAMITVQPPLAPGGGEKSGCGCFPGPPGVDGGHLPAFLLLALSLIFLRSRCGNKGKA